MIGAAKITSASLDYYESTVDRGRIGADLQDYYSEHGDVPPRAFVASRTAEGVQATADRLGVENGQTVTSEQVEPWFGEGVTPNGEQMGRKFSERSVRGFDLTVAAPKSVSLLWALGDEEQQRAAEAAHQAGIDNALTYLSRHAAYSQQRDESGEIRIVPVQALSGAQYDHRTNRAVEPHLHSHVLLHNRQLLEDGTWGSLDGTSLYHEIRAAGMVYQSTLRASLTQSLGVEWQPVDERSGMADLAGVDREVIEAWSTRRTAINEWVADHCEHDSAEARTTAQHATRDPKALGATTNELRDRWHADDRSRGFDAAALSHREGLGVPDDIRPSAEAVLLHVTQTRSTFTRADLIESAATLLPSEGDPATRLREVEALADQALDATDSRGERLTVSTEAPARQVDQTLERDPESRRIIGKREGSIRYTTSRVLAQEVDALRTAGEQTGHATSPALVNAEGLSGQQAEAMRGIVGSEQRATVLVAPAGAGKTHSLHAARAAWAADDREVYGLAPSGRAADEMTKAGVVGDAQTIATALGQLDRGERPWAPGSVVVVDEAGMAATDDLHRLLKAAKDAETRLVLVGDPEQLDAPAARGGLLHMLAEDLPGTQKLTEVWRQKDAEERTAGLAIRDGQAKDAADWYSKAGRLQYGDESAMLEDAYCGWKADRDKGLDALLLAPTWDVAGALNARAQHDMIAAGKVNANAGALGIAGGEKAHIGDTILTRQNDYRQLDSAGQPIRNGHRWFVRSLRDDTGRAVIERADAPGVRCQVTPEYLAQHARLGYAATIHSAQGATADTSHVLVDADRGTRGLAYVGMTRGKESNRAYLMRRTVEHDHPHHGENEHQHEPYRAGRLKTREAFEGVLERDDRDRAAHQVIREQVSREAARTPEQARDAVRTPAAQADRERQSIADRMWEQTQARAAGQSRGWSL